MFFCAAVLLLVSELFNGMAWQLTLCVLVVLDWSLVFTSDPRDSDLAEPTATTVSCGDAD